MELAILLGSLQLFLFLWTLFTIAKSNEPKNRKRNQVAFSFLIPLIGPFLILAIHLSGYEKNKPSDREIGQSINEDPYSGLD